MTSRLVVIPTRRAHSNHAEVARSIGIDIIAGRYAEGGRLPGDAELTAMFGVSRPVLRESVKTLVAKGLLTTKARVGTVVRERGAWNMFDADVLAWHLDAGIDRTKVYVTNVVKHFKWQARGKRRIHQKPNWSEIAACRPWLEAELAVVEPRVLVCLGATAAQALLGRQFRVTRERGRPVESDLAQHVIATIHPSSILRSDPETREQEYAAFVEDLRIVAKFD